jgi:preprotein translocase subunit SecE
LLRALGVIVALAVGALVAFTSLQGRTLWKFIQGARVELNKVVWPTREETIQTTLVVLLVAVIGGVFFFLIDQFLLWLTTTIMGRGSS